MDEDDNKKTQTDAALTDVGDTDPSDEQDLANEDKEMDLLDDEIKDDVNGEEIDSETSPENDGGEEIDTDDGILPFTKEPMDLDEEGEDEVLGRGA